MIATLIKYKLIDKCIDVIFDRLTAITTPIPRPAMFKPNTPYIAIEMVEQSITPYVSGRRIEVTRMDSYHHGIILDCRSDSIAITFSKQSMIFKCCSRDFDDFYAMLTKLHGNSPRTRILASAAASIIHVEINAADAATVDFIDISEIAMKVDGKIIRREFI